MIWFKKESCPFFGGFMNMLMSSALNGCFAARHYNYLHRRTQRKIKWSLIAITRSSYRLISNASYLELCACFKTFLKTQDKLKLFPNNQAYDLIRQKIKVENISLKQHPSVRLRHLIWEVLLRAGYKVKKCTALHITMVVGSLGTKHQ